MVKIKDVVFNGKIHATMYGDFGVGVILCPPHPLFGGSRNDFRLVYIARKLAENGLNALCIDYGSYQHGVGEVQDVLTVINHLQNFTDKLGLLGYSFGAVVASVVSTQTKNIKAVVYMSILEKVNGLKANLKSKHPKLFIHGKYDTIASYKVFKKLYDEAEKPKECLILETDHFYTEKMVMENVSEKICSFFLSKLQ